MTTASITTMATTAAPDQSYYAHTLYIPYTQYMQKHSPKPYTDTFRINERENVIAGMGYT